MKYMNEFNCMCRKLTTAIWVSEELVLSGVIKDL